MAQLRVTAEDFILTSKYTCSRTAFLAFDADGNVLLYDENNQASATDANFAEKTIGFTFRVPDNAKVTNVSFHATLSEPEEGTPAVSVINWQTATPGSSVSRNISLDSLDTLAGSSKKFSATFGYLAKSDYHFHDHTDCTRQSDDWEYTDLEANPNAAIVKKLHRTFFTDHSSTVLYSDIYLLIDYEVGEGSDDTGGSGSSGEDSGSTNAPTSGVGRAVVEAGDFWLTSKFQYELVEKYWFTTADHTNPIHAESEPRTLPPTMDEEEVRFPLNLPRGAIVKNAYVHAKLGSGKYPVKTLSIAGRPVSHGSTVQVPVPVNAGADCVYFKFEYECDDSSFDPDSFTQYVTTDYWEYEVASENNCDIHTFVDTAYCESVVNVSDLYLVVEYTMPGGLWSLADNIVEPNETLDVTLDEVTEGYTYTMQVALNENYVSAEMDIPLDKAAASFTVPVDWLYAIPNSPSGVGKVTVREYLDGELVNETAKNFTLVCPESAKPTFLIAIAKPLQTVDGVTYPAPMLNVFIQNKCGVTAQWGGISAHYGARVVSQHVNVGGYEGDAYNVEGVGALDPANPQLAGIYSGLLTEAGEIPVTLTVTDSRGMTSVFVQNINVLAYEPPSVTDLSVWRVNADGVADELGQYVKYSFIPSGAYTSGLINELTATLTAAGKSETFKVESDAVNSGWLFPNSIMPFDDSVYALELTLTDLWESVTFKAVTIPPITGTTVVIRPNPKRKRGLIIGDYDTVLEGNWTMSALSFPEPDPVQNFIDVPGRMKGPLDMSTVLTGGVPTYGSRTLSASFELSDGTRRERDEIISRMVNQLHGRRWEITLPDDPDRYIVGRVSVVKEYSDMAHAKVNVTAICEPWRYNKLETVVGTEQTPGHIDTRVVLYNAGGCSVIPTITVETEDSAIFTIAHNDAGLIENLPSGTYKLPKLLLHPGNTVIVAICNGTGKITFTYREAVL